MIIAIVQFVILQKKIQASERWKKRSRKLMPNHPHLSTLENIFWKDKAGQDIR
jgi:hypothetical protein